MAFSSTVQPVSAPPKPVEHTTVAASILSVLLLSLYAAKKSKRAMRKMKRRLMWIALKLKVKSMFSKRQASDRTLLYILLGVLVLALLLINVVVGLIVLLALLILYLLGALNF